MFDATPIAVEHTAMNDAVIVGLLLLAFAGTWLAALGCERLRGGEAETRP